MPKKGVSSHKFCSCNVLCPFRLDLRRYAFMSILCAGGELGSGLDRCVDFCYSLLGERTPLGRLEKNQPPH